MAAATAEKRQAMYLFNCAQRAHANWDENFPPTLVTLLIAGLQNPRWAAGLGGFWLANRLVFALGYTMPSKREGKGRLYGELMWAAQFGLLCMTVWWGWNLLN